MSEVTEKANKKMLAILASLRKDGNVAKMLDFSIGEAKQHGYDTELVDLYERDIAYCKGCMACKKTGVCTTWAGKAPAAWGR